VFIAVTQRGGTGENPIGVKLPQTEVEAGMCGYNTNKEKNK
jgi:hypothetical protein